MVRGGWFLSLAVIAAGLVVVRLALRRPLLPVRARTLSPADAVVAGVSLALLVFHCAAMFAPEVVAALGVLDRPAAVVRDLRDPVGQAAYWIPAATLVVGLRRLWWPAPVGTALSLVAVGWTMYGDFTVTEHVATIVAAGVIVVAAPVALVTGLHRRGGASTA